MSKLRQAPTHCRQGGPRDSGHARTARWQGHGIATALLLQLAEYARAHGMTRLVAITMASNACMLEVLRHCGYPSTIGFGDGEDEVSLDISAPLAAALAPLPFIPDTVP